MDYFNIIIPFWIRRIQFCKSNWRKYANVFKDIVINLIFVVIVASVCTFIFMNATAPINIERNFTDEYFLIFWRSKSAETTVKNTLNRGSLPYGSGGITSSSKNKFPKSLNEFAVNRVHVGWHPNFTTIYPRTYYCGNEEWNRPVKPHLRYRRGVVHKEMPDYRWETPEKEVIKHLTYSIFDYPSKTTMTRAEIKEVYHQAFNLWAKHSGLTFKHITGAKRLANLRIYYTKVDNQKGGILARAYFPTSGKISGRIEFDYNEYWVKSDEKLKVKNEIGISLLGVAIHEIGHALGLQHVTENTQCIMYPAFVGSMRVYHLCERERNRIQALYGHPEPNKQLLNDKVEWYWTNPPTTTRPPGTTMQPVNPCGEHIDAIIPHYREMFIFSGKYFWSVMYALAGDDYKYYYIHRKPSWTKRFFTHIPRDVTHFDAVISFSIREYYFFAGKRVIRLRGNTAQPEEKTLENLGIHNVEKIDTAFVWSYHSKKDTGNSNEKKFFFIFAGEEYWKLEYTSNWFTFDKRRYPIKIKDTWKNVPLPVDEAVTHEGTTFFMKNKVVYTFNDRMMQVDNRYPSETYNKVKWFGCLDI